MPLESGRLTERITLQRLNDATKAYEDLLLDGYGEGGYAEGGYGGPATIWAAAEPQGDAVYRFRIRYRDDLRTKADIAPAMRVIYHEKAYDLIDIIEADRRTETHLIVRRRIIEDIEELETGARRIKAWP